MSVGFDRSLRGGIVNRGRECQGASGLGLWGKELVGQLNGPVVR